MLAPQYLRVEQCMLGTVLPERALLSLGMMHMDVREPLWRGSLVEMI